jgi:multiple sugar transport system ATP-binding protein
MSSQLVLEALSKQFGATPAVCEVSMTVGAGEMVALVGPSGCGKSTILRIVSGLEPPTSGRVLLDGRDVTELPAGRRNIGMVFQQPATFPHLSVADNLSFGMKLRHVNARERRLRVAEVADLLGIGALLARRPAQLSGGERQRVEIGRALLRDPSVLLLDEPLSSLDAHLRTELRGELARVQREVGTTTIVVTHDQSEAMVLGNRVGVMREGRLVQLAPADELFDAPTDTFVARFVGSPPMNLLPARVYGGAVWLDGTRLADARGVRTGPVLLGVRPTDITLAELGLAAEVTTIENQGADLVVALRVNDTSAFTVRVPRADLGLLAGPVRLGMRAWHLFDPDTGLRLTPDSTPPGATRLPP